MPCRRAEARANARARSLVGQAAVIRRADYASRVALLKLQRAAAEDFEPEHRAAAAATVVGNREAIVADAVDGQPKSQLNLKSLPGVEDEDEDAPRESAGSRILIYRVPSLTVDELV